MNRKDWDNLKYSAKHKWAAKNRPKPELCEVCHSKPPTQIANVSQEYKQDIEDWRHVCGITCNNSFRKIPNKNNKCLNEEIERLKIWKENNPEKLNAIKKKWEENNPDYYKEYFENRKDEKKEYDKFRYQSNKEKLKAKANHRYKSLSREDINLKRRSARSNLSEKERSEINAKRRIAYQNKKLII